MKNLMLLNFVLVLFIFSCGKNSELLDQIPELEEEEQNEKVFEGSVVLHAQSQVDDFGAGAYTRIKLGNLEISSEDTSDPIIDLSTLENLKEVEGSVEIVGTHLETLKGLNRLKHVGSELTINANSQLKHLDDLAALEHVVFHFLIGGNNSLKSIDGLERLHTVEALFYIFNNPELEEINGLNNLESVDGNLGCSIAGNEKLTKISGFNSLRSGEVNFEGNPNLSIIEGFSQFNDYGVSLVDNESLVSVGGFENFTNGELFLKDNGQLTGFPAFSRLTIIADLWIENNDQLESLEDLESLTSIARLFIKDNSKLVNYCALTNAVETIPEDSFSLYSNRFNPSLQDFQNGDCEE